MSGGLIILIIITVIFGYILFFPMTVKIDTDKNQYYFRLPGVFGFRVMNGKSGWEIGYSVFLLRFQAHFFKSDKHRKKPDQEHPKTIKGFPRRRFRFDYLSLGINLIQAFRLKRLRWSIDTGDYPVNARLIPVASYLNDDLVSLSVNFNDNNAFYLVLQSYLARIFYIIIRHFMFNR